MIKFKQTINLALFSWPLARNLNKTTSGRGIDIKIEYLIPKIFKGGYYG